MNELEIKDLFVADLDNNGDLTSVIWNKLHNRKSMRCDWVTYENASRIIFQLHQGNQLSERMTIVAMAELLSAITGRGPFLA